MTLTTWIITWLICGIICAIIASNKGHGFGLWFLIGALFGPLAILVAIAKSNASEKIEAKELANGNSIKCPSCAETVKSAALICKHCGRDLPRTNTNTQNIDKTQYNSAIIDGDLIKLKELIAVGGDISHIKDDLIAMADAYGQSSILQHLKDLK